MKNKIPLSTNTRIAYTVAEAADLLGISRITVYRRIESGDWPSTSLDEKVNHLKKSRKLIPAKFLHDKFNQGFAPCVIGGEV